MPTPRNPLFSLAQQWFRRLPLKFQLSLIVIAIAGVFLWPRIQRWSAESRSGTVATAGIDSNRSAKDADNRNTFPSLGNADNDNDAESSVAGPVIDFSVIHSSDASTGESATAGQRVEIEDGPLSSLSSAQPPPPSRPNRDPAATAATRNRPAETRSQASRPPSRSTTDSRRNPNDSGAGTSRSNPSSTTRTAPATSAQKPVSTRPKYGELQETKRNVFVSTAGLEYGPGGDEGHRLTHLLRHAEDDPDRPGNHGVFDGDKERILAVLDEAYTIGKKGGWQVRKETDRGRTVYTVNMKRRIGFIGGESGRRKRNPVANHVRLVLEGNEVITAYPIKP